MNVEPTPKDPEEKLPAPLQILRARVMIATSTPTGLHRRPGKALSLCVLRHECIKRLRGLAWTSDTDFRALQVCIMTRQVELKP